MSVINLLDLPDDILINIFKLLSLKDIGNLIQTSKLVRNLIAENRSLWRYLTRNDLIIGDIRNFTKYTDLMTYNYARSSYNWGHGIYHAKQIVKFRKKYMPSISYSPEMLLLSVGSELRCFSVNKHGMPNCRRTLWKLNVPKLRTEYMMTNDISRFKMKDTLIACGYRDGTANLYKVDDNTKEPRLIQHLTKCHDNGVVEVTCVDVICKPGRSFMVTGSDRSQEIVIWRWRDDGSFQNVQKNPVRRFKEVTMDEYLGARSLSLNKTGDTIVIGPDFSNKPIFFDVNTMSIIKHTGPRLRREVVRDVYWHDENTVAYVSHGSTLALMDVRTQETIYEQADPFFTPLYCVRTDGNNAIVAGASQYARCVLYDRRKNNHVQMYFTQKEKSPVYGLDISSTKLLAAIDRSVGIVDFDVNADRIKPKDYSSYVFLSDFRS